MCLSSASYGLLGKPKAQTLHIELSLIFHEINAFSASRYFFFYGIELNK